MSNLRVASLRGRKVKTSPSLPDGAVITGITTATSFGGNLTGNVTGNVVGNITGDVAGNITGTAGTFSGNVSIGGTITYEDVTSIDSVGVITARNGIKVSAGQSISAVSGIVTYYGDGSKLSGIDHGVVNFEASGTIANGATVIIKTDGTVAGVSTVIVNNVVGTDQTWLADRTEYFGSVSIGNGKIVIAYQDYNDSNKGKAVVGTVTGKTISFGTPVEFSAAYAQLGICYDSSADRIVLVYRLNSTSTPYGIAGQVSGTSITFGSAVEVFGSFGGGGPIVIVHDSSVSRNVVFFRSSGNTGTSVVLSVSGTTLSVHSSQTFQSGQVQYIAACYDSNAERIVVGYGGYSQSQTFRVKVGNVSSTSVTYGSHLVLVDDWVFSKALGFDPSVNKVIAYWSDYNHGGSATRWGRAKVGTVDPSNNTISFSGSEYSFADYNVDQDMSHTFDSVTNKNILAFRNIGDGNDGAFITSTVSGNVISFGSTTIFTTDEVGYGEGGRDVVFDATSKNTIFTYRPFTDDAANRLHGISRVFTPTDVSTNLTTENYIGIAAEAIADGATGKINVVTGTNTGQTGLTTAKTHYIQNNGTLSTSAGDPSVVAGTAISDTKILVRKS